MNKLIFIFVGILLVIAFIPTIQSLSDDYDILYNTESFVAVEDNLTQEVITLDYIADEVISVYINDVLATVTTDYTVSDDTITFTASSTTTSDDIDVNYSYDFNGSSVTDTLATLTPMIIVISLLAISVIFIPKMKKG